MKRYDPGLEGPCPELERAVMQVCPKGEYVKADDVIAVIKGCWDYGGGYRGDAERLEIYRHGMQTVLNAMCGALKPDGSDLQSDVLLSIGRKTNESLKSLIDERDRLLASLKEIAAYDQKSPHGEGICQYGCDAPWLAKTALGISCDVPSEIGDC